jgi:nitroreductase
VNMFVKKARTDRPIQELLATRFSPYGFADRPVSHADLAGLFEAARWAASSFNEQPWSYVVAQRRNPEEFELLLSCLTEGNQEWAGRAPALALGTFRKQFTRNGRPNRVALHDLGLASATLTVEAEARGLSVHQMAGILPDRARELYGIPEGVEVATALAIGYAADPGSLPEKFKRRDLKPRERRPTREFVFAGTWGRSADWLDGK